jgi:hypothetical protein
MSIQNVFGFSIRFVHIKNSNILEQLCISTAEHFSTICIQEPSKAVDKRRLFAETMGTASWNSQWSFVVEDEQVIVTIVTAERIQIRFILLLLSSTNLL